MIKQAKKNLKRIPFNFGSPLLQKRSKGKFTCNPHFSIFPFSLLTFKWRLKSKSNLFFVWSHFNSHFSFDRTRPAAKGSAQKRLLITWMKKGIVVKIKWKIEKGVRIVCINFYTNVYPYQLSCKMNRVNVIWLRTDKMRFYVRKTFDYISLDGTF